MAVEPLEAVVKISVGEWLKQALHAVPTDGAQLTLERLLLSQSVRASIPTPDREEQSAAVNGLKAWQLVNRHAFDARRRQRRDLLAQTSSNFWLAAMQENEWAII